MIENSSKHSKIAEYTTTTTTTSTITTTSRRLWSHEIYYLVKALLPIFSVPLKKRSTCKEIVRCFMVINRYSPQYTKLY